MVYYPFYYQNHVLETNTVNIATIILIIKNIMFKIESKYKPSGDQPKAIGVLDKIWVCVKFAHIANYVRPYNLGAIISMIVLPILSWYKNAKKDGKITTDEINQLLGATYSEDLMVKTLENVFVDIKQNAGTHIWQNPTIFTYNAKTIAIFF